MPLGGTCWHDVFCQPWYGFYSVLWDFMITYLINILLTVLFPSSYYLELFYHCTKTLTMGNEGSLPSDGSTSPVSDWQSLYSYGSRAGRRSSLGSARIPSPMEPPEPDLSHLTTDEIAQIRSVIGRAKEMKDEENKRIR